MFLDVPEAWPDVDFYGFPGNVPESTTSRYFLLGERRLESALALRCSLTFHCFASKVRSVYFTQTYHLSYIHKNSIAVLYPRTSFCHLPGFKLHTFWTPPHPTFTQSSAPHSNSSNVKTTLVILHAYRSPHLIISHSAPPVHSAHIP